MAESNYREYLNGEIVRAKKYFYVLRPILACKWILEKETPPPMLFSELMESQLDEPMKPVVEKLLQIKMNEPEVKLIPRVDALNEYLDVNLTKVHEQIELLPKEEVQDWDELNELFLSELEM